MPKVYNGGPVVKGFPYTDLRLRLEAGRAHRLRLEAGRAPRSSIRAGNGKRALGHVYTVVGDSVLLHAELGAWYRTDVQYGYYGLQGGNAVKMP